MCRKPNPLAGEPQAAAQAGKTPGRKPGRKPTAARAAGKPLAEYVREVIAAATQAMGVTEIEKAILMVKAGLLKRAKLAEGKGSTYTVA